MKRFYNLRHAMLYVIITMIVMVHMSCATPHQEGASISQGSGSTDSDSHEDVALQWGIDVLSLRLTSADYMLDFRYRVLDPEKAAIFLNRRIKPYLILESTGQSLSLTNPPKGGPMRQYTEAPEKGRIYFMIFQNENKVVQRGMKVTLEIGEVRLPGITVE